MDPLTIAVAWIVASTVLSPIAAALVVWRLGR